MSKKTTKISVRTVKQAIDRVSCDSINELIRIKKPNSAASIIGQLFCSVMYFFMGLDKGSK